MAIDEWRRERQFQLSIQFQPSTIVRKIPTPAIVLLLIPVSGLQQIVNFPTPVSADDHLRIESSYSYRAETATRDGMLKVSDSPGIFVRAACVLCVALMCVMGTVQATHSHPENSTTSHHSCSICATAHVGLNTQTVVSTPVIVTAALASPVAAVSLIFRPSTTQFIRPPPAL